MAKKKIVGAEAEASREWQLSPGGCISKFAVVRSQVVAQPQPTGAQLTSFVVAQTESGRSYLYSAQDQEETISGVSLH